MPAIREIAGTAEWFKILGITMDQFFSVPELAQTRMEDLLKWLEDHDSALAHVDLERADISDRRLIFPDQATMLLFKLTWG